MLSREHVNHTRIRMSFPDSDFVSIMVKKFDEKKTLKIFKNKKLHKKIKKNILNSKK